MNAYFASFMLLLFNAVGLAVPASAAAAERVVPELGSAASLSEAEEAKSSVIIAATGHTIQDHQTCAWAEACLVASRTMGKIGSNTPDWAVVTMRREAGDKLEHEEGAP